MSTDLTKLLTLLTEAAGPSGNESRISRVIEQTFIHVTDLFDIEGAKAETTSFGGTTTRHLDLQKLQRFQQVQHRAIVDRQRIGFLEAWRVARGGWRG